MEFHWLQWMQLLHWLQLHWLPCVQCTGCRTCTMVDYVAAAVILGAEVAVEWVGKIIAVRSSKFLAGSPTSEAVDTGFHWLQWMQWWMQWWHWLQCRHIPERDGIDGSESRGSGGCAGRCICRSVASPSGPQVVEVLCKWICYILCYCCVQ